MDGVRCVYQLEAGIDISATLGDQADQQLSQQPSQRRAVQPQQLHRIFIAGSGVRSISAKAMRPIKIRPPHSTRSRANGATMPLSWATPAAITASNSARASRHAVWYESPTVGGWQWSAMYAPGENKVRRVRSIRHGEYGAGGSNPESARPDFRKRLPAGKKGEERGGEERGREKGRREGGRRGRGGKGREGRRRRGGEKKKERRGEERKKERGGRVKRERSERRRGWEVTALQQTKRTWYDDVERNITEIDLLQTKTAEA